MPRKKKYAPMKGVIERATEKQGHVCLYCQLPFGTVVSTRTGDKTQTPVADHYVPVAWYNMRSEDNIVAACQICNTLKADILFESVQEAWRYIAQKRVAKRIHVVFLPTVSLTEDAASWANEYSHWLSEPGEL